MTRSAADPGFPVGGHRPLGGTDLRCGHFLAEMYAKTKELGPVGGAPAAPPGSVSEGDQIKGIKTSIFYVLKKVTMLATILQSYIKHALNFIQPNMEKELMF